MQAGITGNMEAECCVAGYPTPQLAVADICIHWSKALPDAAKRAGMTVDGRLPCVGGVSATSADIRGNA